MKIVHVVAYFQPQLGYQEYFLAKEHLNQGYEVHIITSDRYYPFNDYDNTVKKVLGERIIGERVDLYEGITVYRLSVEKERGARVKLSGIQSILKILKPDIVIHHGVMSSYTLKDVVKSQKKEKFSLICDDHMLFTVEDKRNYKHLFKNYIYYSFISRTYWKNSIIKYIGVADECSIYLNRRLGISKKKITTVPLGADLEIYKYSDSLRISTREELNILDDEICIIYTGKLMKSKDPALILHASKELSKKYKLKFLFVGNIDESYLEKFNEMKKIFNEKIIHIPAQNTKNLPKYYCASDIAIWPREASTSMIDAAACKLPIIVCNYLTERISNNNGIGIREGNLDDIKNALEFLISNKEKRIEMGKNGRILVEKELNWQIIAKKFINIAMGIN